MLRRRPLVLTAALAGLICATAGSPELAGARAGTSVGSTAGRHSAAQQPGRTDRASSTEQLGSSGFLSMLSLSSDGFPSNGDSGAPLLSADGQVAVFTSTATNLGTTQGDDFEGSLYERDMATGVTTPIDPALEQYAGWYALSADGQWVTYSYYGPGGQDGSYELNLQTGQKITLPEIEPYSSVVISADGRYIAWLGPDVPEDDNWGLWMWDRSTGTIRNLMTSSGGPLNSVDGDEDLVMSSDGSTVAFSGKFPNLETDPAIDDTEQGTALYVMSTAPGSLPHYVLTPSGDTGNGWSYVASLSATGRYLAFNSTSTNWTAGGGDKNGTAYLDDLQTGTITNIARLMNGSPADASVAGLSGDGTAVAFESSEVGIVPDDSNMAQDDFVYDTSDRTTTRVSVGPDGQQLTGVAGATMSQDGSHIAFVAQATNLGYAPDAEVGGQVMEETVPGGSAAGFSASVRSHALALRWGNPRANFGGVVVRGSAGSKPPTCATCGFAVYAGKASHAVSKKLKNGRFYRYALFSKTANGVVRSREITAAMPLVRRAPVRNDLDGNGVSDPLTYDPMTKTWYWPFQRRYTHFGKTSGGVPVPAPYLGNGATQLAMFTQKTGVWAIRGRAKHIGFGKGGEPVPADYGGVGRVQLAVFYPSTGTWRIRGYPHSIHFGRKGDIPVPADYNGDGKAEIAVFRPSTGRWLIFGQKHSIKLGRSGDIPVPADYNGTGHAQPAVYRFATATWLIRGRAAVKFGTPGRSLPDEGDYNGDGRTDIAVLDASQIDVDLHKELQLYVGPGGPA